MSRPWRIQFPNAVYHILSRGNFKQNIFIDDHDRKKFLKLLEGASSRFNIEIFAFCLMDNHYHLFLRTTEGNISKTIHWLNTSYTNYFHRKHRTSGHLMQGRFKSILVTDKNYWLDLSIFIHLNTVRAKIVDDPNDYEWSSYRDYVTNKIHYEWLKPEYILSHCDTDRENQRKYYENSCVELNKKQAQYWEKFKKNVILGSNAHVERILKKHPPDFNFKEVTSFIKTSKKGIDLDEELSNIANYFSVKKDDLKKRHRNFIPKQAAYYHLVESCSLQVNEVGRLLGVSSTAVSNGIKRLKDKMKVVKSIEEMIKALKKRARS